MYVPQRWFNAYKGPRNEQGGVVRGQKLQANSIRPGDLQLHFAGKKTTKLLMPKWIDLAANESAGWAVPLEKTKLKAEVALFWKLEKEKSDWDTPVASKKSKDKVDKVATSEETASTTSVAKPTSSSKPSSGKVEMDASGEGDASEGSSISGGESVALAVENGALAGQDQMSEDAGNR